MKTKRIKTPTYHSWAKMKERCYNPRNNRYARYGGVGIAVCEAWHTFANFLADMGERPSGKTLDRLDNTKGYEPGNCRWATPSEQALNRRSTKIQRSAYPEIIRLHLSGISKTELAFRHGVCEGSIRRIVKEVRP